MGKAVPVASSAQGSRGIFGKARNEGRNKKRAESINDDQVVMVTGSGEYGSKTAVKAGRVLAWGLAGVLLIGSISGIAALLTPSPPPVSASVQDSVEDQTVKGLAVGIVNAWLSATSSDSSRLAEYFSGQSLQITNKEPVKASNVQAVASQRSTDGTITITVAAEITTQSPGTDSSKPSAVSTMRYYTVPFGTVGGSYQVLSLPALITEPPVEKAPSSLYRSQVSSSEVKGAVEGFFKAYLSADGELGRFTAPSANLEPVTPAAFEAVKIISINSTSDIGRASTSKSPVEVLVTVEGSSTATDQSSRNTMTMTYPLELIPRSGRWEISQIRPSPLTTQESQEKG
ncbi:conjugal transfer protein [Acaricomes phytoseiuli]|uniref:conjugal transfer protein n=1 Tax=Acaricomes phytoseiuli TaxID=291968 RepID=UPI0009FCD74A|nr:conjugal transfer protein [Acaricomes phytoseiuli]